MIYDSLVKKIDHANNKTLFKILEKINGKHILNGGLALVLYYKSIYRIHNDIDLYIQESDINYWKNFSKNIDLDFKHYYKNHYAGFYKNKKIIDYTIFETLDLANTETIKFNNLNYNIKNLEITKKDKLERFNDTDKKDLKYYYNIN